MGAAGAGLAARLTGVDLNPKSEGVARAETPAAMPIDYRTGDYRDLGRFDFVVSSLVAHHMTDGQLRDFLRWMEANADRGWFVNDLHRHRFAYFGFPLLAALLRVHRIVREDGQLSIARAFRPDDWRAILAEAGVADGRPGSAAISRSGCASNGCADRRRRARPARPRRSRSPAPGWRRSWSSGPKGRTTSSAAASSAGTRWPRSHGSGSTRPRSAPARSGGFG